jgi:hypothetical protein
MSRFVGRTGQIGEVIKIAGGQTVTGEILHPTTNSGANELVTLCRSCCCISPGSPNRSHCALTVVNLACCGNNGSTDSNPLTCNWVVPNNVCRVTVQMWGGGGGGGRGCGPAGRGIGHPGGAGAFMQFGLCVLPNETYSIRVGSGGTGVTYGGMGCQGGCTRINGPGLDVITFGGQGGPACACMGCCAPGGTISLGNTGRIVPGSLFCCCGQPVMVQGPWCACSACCRAGASRKGADPYMGSGARGGCRGRRNCSDAGGCFNCSFAGGGAGGTGHGSGQGLYSTPCCRGGRGGAGMLIIWM